MTHDECIQTKTGNQRTVTMYRCTSVGFRRDRSGELTAPKVLAYYIEISYHDRPELDFSEVRRTKAMATNCFKTWARLCDA